MVVVAADDPRVVAALEQLAAGIAAVAGLDTDGFSDEAVRGLLRGVQPQIDRLAAVRARLTGDLAARAIAAAPRELG